MQGRTFTQPILENPFRAMEAEVARIREETPVIFVDIHAETTSEKVAMGRFLDGRVSAVVGTHHARPDRRRARFSRRDGVSVRRGVLWAGGLLLGQGRERHRQPVSYRLAGALSIARGEVRLHGAIVEIDPTTGRAQSIRRVAEVHESTVSSAPPTRTGALEAAVDVPAGQVV